MRRVLVGALVGAIGLLPLVGAHADEETPQGTFNSPTRAVAGAPIWVRSITPCPVVDGAYQFVRVGIGAQSAPSVDYVESTDADLFADGSWEVTLSAPTEMPNGITKSYEIQVQCIRDLAPYEVPERDPAITTTTLDPSVSIFRYFYRRLYVTGFGTADADPGLVGANETTTTTSTTSTTVPGSSTTTSQVIATTSTTLPSFSFSRRHDEKQRAAEARAEIAAQQAGGSSDVALSSTPASSSSPVPSTDGGAPWWSFVLATVLAVGAVVGYGAKRGSGA